MASIRVAIDQCYGYSSDIKTLNSFAEKLRAAGHTVSTEGRGPNRIQSVMSSESKRCDLMIQIACGKCLGTLCDFHLNIKSGWYKAKAGGFAYYKCWDPNWKAHRSGDDNFSHRNATIRNEVNSKLGKTLPEIYAGYPEMYYGYGDNAEELAKTFLQNYSGSSNSTSTSTENVGGGSSALDAIKEVASDLDPYGPELKLKGNTLSFCRTNPNKRTLLSEDNIVNNSISFSDYDNTTPNTYKSYKDTPLYNRFGEIPLDSGVDSSWEDQVLLMGQRGHGHSIDLKCIYNKNYLAGNWVLLDYPSLNINKKPYYITKSSFDEERQLSVTLEPGPPSLYVEKMEVAEETTDSEEVDENV